MNAKLQHADLRMANLERAYLEGADVRKAMIRETRFLDTNLSHILTDRSVIALLPESHREKYGETFLLSAWDDIQISTDSIIRSIEFPPKYHAAGISILNHFGNVLRRQHPDKKARIRIEQEGLKVTMVIDRIEGDREIFEHTLDEYGLVITGKMQPEEFSNDPFLVMELKNELRMAQTRIESQKELLQYQDTRMKEKDLQLDQFLRLMELAFRNPRDVTIKIQTSSESQVQIEQKLQLEYSVSLLQGSLNELKGYVSSLPKEASEIDDIQTSLEEIEKSVSADEIRKSPAMSKLRRFLEALGDPDSKLSKTIGKIEHGVDIVRRLAGYYNKLADWCGLPHVPKPFSK